MSAPPDIIVSLAVDTANRGPCAKSKRGVVIYELAESVAARDGGNVGRIWGLAYNSPPWPFECSGTDACKKDCRHICVHAEQRAIIRACLVEGEATGNLNLGKRELYLVHVKTVDGKLVPSTDGPCCEQCSKLILEAGIRFVWLYVAENQWSLYDATGFHQSTLIACNLHRHL